MFAQVGILLGEIRCLSLLMLKGLNMEGFSLLKRIRNGAVVIICHALMLPLAQIPGLLSYVV